MAPNTSPSGEDCWRTAGSIGTLRPSASTRARTSARVARRGHHDQQRGARTQVSAAPRHGQPAKYLHDIEGYNGRLDAIQAGILSTKLRHLAKWNDQRRENARRYGELSRTPTGRSRSRTSRRGHVPSTISTSCKSRIATACRRSLLKRGSDRASIIPSRCTC